MKISLQFAFALALLPTGAFTQSNTTDQTFTVLHPDDYHHYVTQFATDEREATDQQPADEWPWLRAYRSAAAGAADSPADDAADGRIQLFAPSPVKFQSR